MHKVYENKDLMMYFRKRYCRCCGKPLTHRRCERVVRKGDEDHFEYCTIGRGYKPHGDILVVGVEYYCEHCCKAFSCDEQSDIKRAQKILGKKIVSEDEIAYVKTGCTGSIKGAKERIEKEGGETVAILKKNKRYLWIPFVGLIAFLRKTEKKHFSSFAYYLTSLASFFFILIAEFLYTFLFRTLKVANLLPAVIIENYDIGMLVVALLVCNIPAIIAVNRKIKKLTKSKENNISEEKQV